jgi:indole-3-glycerol phosphate synthase
VGVLQAIIENKRAELAELGARRLPDVFAPRKVTLQNPGALSLIAEIKFRSPSAGALSQVQSVEQRAAAYSRAGAALISVLCDERYFAGSYEHLAQARAASPTPLLCKEFVLDECQLDAARAYGADAVLLIVRCLTDQQLTTLLRGAVQRELLPLVEVCSSVEADRALEAGATCIGVNARDLDTLTMDTERAAEVLDSLPAHIVKVHLSGIKTPKDVARVAFSSASAALIGEVLMREDDPERLLTEMVQAARRTF